METDYKKLSDEVFEVINEVRKNPRSIVEELKKMKHFFKGKEYRNPKYDYYIMMDEGVPAIENALDFLENTAMPRDAFERSDNLNQAADELVSHIGPKGFTSHQQEELAMDKRVKKYIQEKGGIAENISFGWGDARDIVVQMVVDDGVKSRGHRKNIFSKNYVKIGISSGKHKTYQHCTVMEFFGEPEKSKVNFENYQIDKEEWPEKAVSLQKHIESKTVNDKKTITLTYTFTLEDGSTIKKTKEFLEEF